MAVSGCTATNNGITLDTRQAYLNKSLDSKKQRCDVAVCVIITVWRWIGFKSREIHHQFNGKSTNRFNGRLLVFRQPTIFTNRHHHLRARLYY